MSASPRDTDARSLTPTTDPDAIGTFWDAMTELGQVGELRIIRKETDQNGRKLIDSAYVDNGHAFVAAAARIHPSYATGAYLTMNPVDPAAPPLALKKDGTPRRPFNKGATRAYKGDTTADEHILARRHLLIDIDAANPTGVSATDQERAAALLRRDEIRAYLDNLGWAPPRVETSSGNGGGLLYDIDLPNDEDAKQLVKRVLEALAARFTTPAATVDVANSNAARITRIPGTVTAKGDHTLERPWRRATATYPEGAGVVNRAQLEALAAHATTTTQRARSRGDAATAGGATVPTDDEGDTYATHLANGATAGQRHHTMTRLVGHYLRCGLSKREIAIILRPWVDRCQPSFPHHELDTVIRDLAEAEARKRLGTVEEAATAVPAPIDDVEPGADTVAPPTLSAAAKELIATQRAELADWKSQARAWESLFMNTALPDKAKRVLAHMHKRFGTPLGRPLSAVMPCTLYADEDDIKAHGLGVSAYKEGRDILLSLGLVTRKQVTKKVSTPAPGEDGANAERRARNRGKDWFYAWGLNGAAINALWAQLPDLTEIAPTERQIKAVESRKERLERAIEEEKPTLHVVRALKREVAEVRKDREKVVYEYRSASYERDTARAQATAAAKERDQALEAAQRIICDNQRPPAGADRIMCRAGCGSFILATDWCCDECREREREEAGDSKLTFNPESSALTPVTVTNRLNVNFESPPPPSGEDLKNCRGGCGTLTPHGWECKPCRGRPVESLHIPDGSAATAQAVHS